MRTILDSMTQSTRWTQRRWWYVLSGTVGSTVLSATALAAPMGNPAPQTTKSPTPKPTPSTVVKASPAPPNKGTNPQSGKPTSTPTAPCAKQPGLQPGKPGQPATTPPGKPGQPSTSKVPAAPEVPKFDGWYLYQTSGVFGDQDIHISKDGIRIVDRKSGITVVSKAPKWNVTTIHPKAKTFCTSPASKYIGMTPADVLTRCGAGTAKIPFVKETRAQVAGMDVLAFVTPKSYEQQQEKAFNNESAGPYFIRNARFIVADKIKVPAQAAKILATHYDVPSPATGLPVDMKYFDLKGNLHVVLVTSSIENKAVSATIFDADTTGLKSLKTSRDVVKSGLTPLKKLPEEFTVKEILVRPNKPKPLLQLPKK